HLQVDADPGAPVRGAGCHRGAALPPLAASAQRATRVPGPARPPQAHVRLSRAGGTGTLRGMENASQSPSIAKRALAVLVVLVAALLYRSDRDELRRQCPRCGGVVMLHDAVCTRCGAELEFPDVVLAPESAAPRPRAP